MDEIEEYFVKIICEVSYEIVSSTILFYRESQGGRIDFLIEANKQQEIVSSLFTTESPCPVMQDIII